MAIMIMQDSRLQELYQSNRYSQGHAEVLDATISPCHLSILSLVCIFKARGSSSIPHMARENPSAHFRSTSCGAVSMFISADISLCASCAHLHDKARLLRPGGTAYLQRTRLHLASKKDPRDRHNIINLSRIFRPLSSEDFGGPWQPPPRCGLENGRYWKNRLGYFADSIDCGIFSRSPHIICRRRVS